MKKVLGILFALLLTACAQPPSAPVSDFTDREGNALTLPERIDRIVTMGPSNTEIIMSLGLTDKLVAVDTYSTWLIDSVPAFDMMQPDSERLIALAPDIVIVTGMSKAEGVNMYQTLANAGICVAFIPVSNTIDGIKEDILFLGRLTGTGQAAQDIVTQMENEIESTIAEYQKLAETNANQRVYFEISAAPAMYSFGKGVFLDEMITKLGAVNIFADRQSWISVSEESVVNGNPDIIFTNVDYIDDPVGEIMSRRGWENIEAVKNGRVYQVSTNPSSLPNQYITVALGEMARALYD